MNDNKSKRKFKKTFMVLIGGIILLFVLALLSYLGYKNVVGKEYINYQETSVLDYIVCYTQPNELDQGCLPQSINNYVSKYIDEVKLNYNYKLALNKEIDAVYKYKIDGELTIYDRNNHSLIFKIIPYDLLEEKTVTKNNIEEIIISELLDLDYQVYDREVINYRNTANVSAGASLRVTLHIESVNKHSKVSEEIKVNNDIVIDIPLGEQTIQLSTNYTPNNQSSNIEVKTNQTLLNGTLKSLAVIFGLGALVLIIITVCIGNKRYKSLPVYTRLINELKNDFDYEISEISSLIDNDAEDNYEYFNAVSFKELFDLVKTSTDKKILWNEKKYYDKKGRLENRVSWFFVFMSDEKVMRFVVDENKLNEEYDSDQNILKKYRG